MHQLQVQTLMEQVEQMWVEEEEDGPSAWVVGKGLGAQAAFLGQDLQGLRLLNGSHNSSPCIDHNSWRLDPKGLLHLFFVPPGVGIVDVGVGGSAWVADQEEAQEEVQEVDLGVVCRVGGQKDEDHEEGQGGDQGGDQEEPYIRVVGRVVEEG